ncbi:hypothetical protein N9Q76_02680 [Flavobacteriales bacterium]|nr:hypothetical protein [Flavobacteriales bacterium]
MKKEISLILFIMISVLTRAQVNLRQTFQIPSELPEASGIISLNNNFWLINDSGNDPIIYKLDDSGNIIHSIYVRGGNIDWEDLTKDDQGNIYIGDFGNNENKRVDLKIYILPYEQLSYDTITPQVINFKYENQSSFPPSEDELDFDCESMIWTNHSLHFFSKNRSKSKQTKIYKIPAAPGNYTAVLKDSILTNGWITSATLTTDGENLILLSKKALYVIKNYFHPLASIQILTFKKSRKEGVCINSFGDVFIAEENKNNRDNYLYSFKLQKALRKLQLKKMN